MKLEFENGDNVNLYDVDSGDLKKFVLLDILDPWHIKEFIVKAENSISKIAFLCKLYHEWLPSLENEFELIMDNNVYEDTFKDSVFRLSNNIHRIKELMDDKDMMKQKIMFYPSKKDIDTLKFCAEPLIYDDGSDKAKKLMAMRDEYYKCIKAGKITKEVLDDLLENNYGYFINDEYNLDYCPELAQSEAEADEDDGGEL